ncbi:MAG: hypothetical protein M3460_08670 [Actinomycetota bacterium]|nr:hypothetical protein [Actinomycetota bacterium]
MAKDSFRIAEEGHAVLMMQQQPQLEAGVGHREPHIQLGGKGYGRLKVELIAVDDTPHFVEFVSTRGSNGTSVADEIFGCPNPRLNLDLDRRIAQVSLQPAKVGRFSALTTADDKQSKTWLTKRRTSA